MTKPQGAAKYEQHPLALKLVPGEMPEEEFAAFCDDLETNGQKYAIILYEGKILEGWHRYRGCLRKGLTPKFEDYTGDHPEDVVISLNIHRRKLGAMQRAQAAAVLVMEYSLSQDSAAKRIGVSKVHVNLVIQALRSKNTRILKLLEKPGLTREQLHEEMVDCGVVDKPLTRTAPVATISMAAASSGIEAMVNQMGHGKGPDEDPEDPDGDDLLGDGPETSGAVDTAGDEFGLGPMLGEPPTAGGSVIGKEKSAGGMPVVGTRPSHPERRPQETAASKLAEAFKGLTEADQISFIQLTWNRYSRLLITAGVATSIPANKEEQKLLDEIKANSSRANEAATAAVVAADAIARAGKGSKASKTSKAT